MSEQQRMKIAKAYVDKQLKTMKRRGSAVKRISSHEYNTLVTRVARAVRA